MNLARSSHPQRHYLFLGFGHWDVVWVGYTAFTGEVGLWALTSRFGPG